MFRDLNKEQQKAVAILGIELDVVTIQIKTGHPQAAKLLGIRDDFFGCVRKCKKLAEIWEKVRVL